MATTQAMKQPGQQAPYQAPESSMHEDEIQIDLVELFYRLLEKLAYIVMAALAGSILAFGVTYFFITPQYTATTKLYVLNAGDSAINLSDLQIGTYLAADYQEVFYNWHVHERVIKRLNLPYTYEEISSMLKITNPSDTRVLYISVTSPDPLEAKQIADTYANVAQEFIATTMETEEPNLFEEALLPTIPSSPSLVKNVLIGFLLGLFGACGLITVWFIVDDRIRTSEDLERYLGLTTLGAMPLQECQMGSAAKKEARKERNA